MIKGWIKWIIHQGFTFMCAPHIGCSYTRPLHVKMDDHNMYCVIKLTFNLWENVFTVYMHRGIVYIPGRLLAQFYVMSSDTILQKLSVV